MILQWKDFSFDLSRRTLVMGILNVTPDSFSDGGLYLDENAAVQRARKMVRQGADIIDVGGMSTRPGSEPVSEAEEIGRTVPVIKAIAADIGVPLSVDTYRSGVAKAAIEAGASIINDISGLHFDSQMAPLAAERGAPVIVMHIKGTPRDMQQDPSYEALVPEIMDYLRQSIRIAEEAGVRDDFVIIDPGIGFGKTFDHNLEIINRLEEFTKFGKPVMVGPSRKAFIGEIIGGRPPSERTFGTAASVAAAVLNGASIVRVHDVEAMVDVVKVADAIKRETVK